MFPPHVPDRWQRKDVWSGALFVFVGAMMTFGAVLAIRKSAPMVFWSSSLGGGLLLLFLGGNAIVRSIRAGRSDRD